MFVTRGTEYHVSWVLPFGILARFQNLWRIPEQIILALELFTRARMRKTTMMNDNDMYDDCWLILILSRSSVEFGGA